MSAAFPQSPLRWILRCLFTLCLSSPIARAIPPVRWDSPTIPGVAVYHGLDTIKYSSHTTSSVRSPEKATPIMASDDRTSVVTEFLGAGYSQFSLLNGRTTETVVGSSIDYFSARLLRDIGLYLAISSVEFQLFDSNARQASVRTRRRRLR